MTRQTNKLDALMSLLKKQPGKHYRLIRLEPGHTEMKKADGYEFVGSKDPEVTGTILAKDMATADGLIRVGGLAVARTTVENRDRLRKEVQAREDRRLRAIKRAYLEDGEKVKRSLGKRHKEFNLIHDTED